MNEIQEMIVGTILGVLSGAALISLVGAIVTKFSQQRDILRGIRRTGRTIEVYTGDGPREYVLNESGEYLPVPTEEEIRETEKEMKAASARNNQIIEELEEALNEGIDEAIKHKPDRKRFVSSGLATEMLNVSHRTFRAMPSADWWPEKALNSVGEFDIELIKACRASHSQALREHLSERAEIVELRDMLRLRIKQAEAHLLRREIELNRLDKGFDPKKRMEEIMSECGPKE